MKDTITLPRSVVERAIAAMQSFVSKCDTGLARSKNSYWDFKAVLPELQAALDAPATEPPVLTKAQAEQIFNMALDLETTGRLVSLTKGQERSDFVARNRGIQCALEDYLLNLTEPAAHGIKEGS